MVVESQSPQTPEPVHLPEQKWLRCKVNEGMFSDELAVTYPAEGDAQKSVFVDESNVQRDSDESGRVRVRVIRQNGHVLAVLPSPEQDIVFANASDLLDA